ncbi:NAD-dependent malic enzyme [Enterobacter cloacae]|uniref:NAD-dependent malic enzyme n=1 Tax=Enterobacter cloacae TaxID=550 RepID=A0A377M203_ENTCL|nr:NAD-dependent malic enzyme [Enterobacter cloacae]
MDNKLKKHRSLYIPYAGPVLLEFPLLNKGSAFSMEERSSFNLLGLLPEVVETIEEQAERAWIQYQGFKTEIDKHIYLRNIQDTNETLFYRLVQNHLEEMMPVIYTPNGGVPPVNASQRSTVAPVASLSLIRTATTWTIFCRTCRTTISK